MTSGWLHPLYYFGIKKYDVTYLWSLSLIFCWGMNIRHLNLSKFAKCMVMPKFIYSSWCAYCTDRTPDVNGGTIHAGYLYWCGLGNALEIKVAIIWKWKLQRAELRHPKNQSERIMQRANPFCWNFITALQSGAQ